MLLDSATAACPRRESHAMPARGMATVARGRVLLAVAWTALTLTGTNWPRGYDGNVIPHGAVFSR
jgi:hypothetical protein